MSSPHLDEAGQAQRLEQLGLVGAAPEERFDRVVRLAREVLHADAAVLAVAGPDRIWFKAAAGIALRETPLTGSLFGAALERRDVLAVPDAAADPRFASAPLVSGPDAYRFFVGRALVEPAGNRVAVLGALGHEPRQPTAAELALFRDVAALAERELGRSALDALLMEYRQGSVWAQAVMDNVSEALITVGSDGCVLSVNRSAEHMFGRRASELVGRDVGQILAPEDREVLERSVRLALARAGDAMRVTHECRGITGAGDRFPVEISLGGTWLAEEDTVLVVVVRDLSHLRREEAMVRQLSRLLEEAHDAIIVLGGPDGRIASWNRGAQETYGYTKDEAIGQSTHDLLHTEFPVPVDEIYATVAATGRWEGQLRHRHRDGHEVVVASRWATLRPEDGLEGAILEINRDVTERVAAESALALSQLRHTATFDKSPMGICLVAADGRLLEVNAALAAFLEQPAGWLVTHTVSDVTYKDDLAPSLENYRQVEQRVIDRFSMEKRYVTGSGRLKWGNLTVAGVFRPDGSLDYFVAMVEDINDRKRAEAQLVEALENQQRAIEELDRISKAKSYFVSLVGHEFRTALTGIQGFSELLSEQEFSSEEVREFAGEIHREGLRLTRMISEMLDLDRMESGRMKLNYGAVDLNAVVGEVVERFAATTDGHRFVTRLDAELGPVEADADKLTQVVSNLVANAIKYSPAGGEITITTRPRGDEVELQVRDQGLGVPVEALETIFERYARHESKDRELIKGTGLGLPVVRQIVEMHGGRVWAANNDPERGATFTFRIPRRPREPRE